MAQDSNIEYETTVFTLKPDNLGPNIATLLHARTTNTDNHFYKAILYLHGYLDYFFQDHVCKRFLEHGYDFYALDMRKCGRSIISPQHDQYKHYCNDLHEFNEEITLAIEHIIKQAGSKNRKIILLGHSTGGLIGSLYACSGTRYADLDAVILNSPYLGQMEMTVAESALLNLIIRSRKSIDFDAGWYGRSIHKSSRGEWDFDLNRKPIEKVRLHGAFFSAVRNAQQSLIKNRMSIKCPVLFMCSNRTIKPDKIWRDEYGEADLILSIKSMRRTAALIASQITMYEIENAKHDIFLSKESVQEKAFELMFRWLHHLEEDWIIRTKI